VSDDVIVNLRRVAVLNAVENVEAARVSRAQTGWHIVFSLLCHDFFPFAH